MRGRKRVEEGWRKKEGGRGKERRGRREGK